MQQDNGTQVMVSGRLVYVIGDLFKGDLAKQFGTQTPKLDKKGQQYQEYGFGLAVPKVEPEHHMYKNYCDIWAALHNEAYKLFTNRVIPPAFHMKFKDGDTGTNQDGSPVNVKTGYPGHIVLNCKTTLQIKFFKYDPATKMNVQINEGIKCGDWVTVQLSIKAHAGTNAGLYLNPNACQLWYCDDEIINAPSGDQIFGTQQMAIPAGKSALPTLPPAQGFAQGAPAPQQPPAAPQGPAVPHYGVLPPVHQPEGAQAVGNGNAGPAGPPMPGTYGGTSQVQPTAPTAFPSNGGMPPLPGR